MNYLKDQFAKGGFKAWLFFYSLTLITVYFCNQLGVGHVLSLLSLSVSFWFLLIAFLSALTRNDPTDPDQVIQFVKKPKEYHMDLAFDLVFGLGIAAIFYFYDIIPHAILAIGATIGDVSCRGSQNDN